MHKKDLLKLCSFFILIILILFLVSRWTLLSLHGRGSHEFNHDYFYELPENSIDVLVVGASHAYCGFIPAEFYEKYGISSYNLSTSNQSMLANYLWVKEAYETQKFKVLVIEAMSVPNSHGNIKNDISSLNSMGLSSHYFELMKTYKRGCLRILFPIIDFHSSWENIKIENFSKDVYTDGDAMRGYVPIMTTASQNSIVQIVDENDTVTTEYLKFPYLDKIKEFCDKNGISLIMMKTPIANPNVNRWSTGYHNVLAQYCEENAIPFFDFNCESLQQESGVYQNLSVAADERHCNYYGASHITDFIGMYISNNYDVVSSNNSFSQDCLDKYHALIDSYSKE